MRAEGVLKIRQLSALAMVCPYANENFLPLDYLSFV